MQGPPSLFRRDGKFFVRTEGPTASSPNSRWRTRSVSSRCSSISSRCPTVGCRRSRSPGMRARGTRSGQRWFHLYLTERFAPTTSCTGRAVAELELHVRGLSLHRRPQELRRGTDRLHDDLVRDQCGVRGVPRSGLAPCGWAAATRSAVAPRHEGLTVHLDDAEASRGRRSDERQRGPIAPRTPSARSRPARVSRPPQPDYRRLRPANRCSITIGRRCSRRPLYHADGQQRGEVYE